MKKIIKTLLLSLILLVSPAVTAFPQDYCAVRATLAYHIGDYRDSGKTKEQAKSIVKGKLLLIGNDEKKVDQAIEDVEYVLVWMWNNPKKSVVTFSNNYYNTCLNTKDYNGV